METMNIALSSEMKEFVREQAEKGGYSSVSEYIRDLIRQAQRRQGKAEFEALVLEGLNSGPATEMTRHDWDQLHAKVRKISKAGKRKTSAA